MWSPKDLVGLEPLHPQTKQSSMGPALRDSRSVPEGEPAEQTGRCAMNSDKPASVNPSTTIFQL